MGKRNLTTNELEIQWEELKNKVYFNITKLVIAFVNIVVISSIIIIIIILIFLKNIKVDINMIFLGIVFYLLSVILILLFFESYTKLIKEKIVTILSNDQLENTWLNNTKNLNKVFNIFFKLKITNDFKIEKQHEYNKIKRDINNKILNLKKKKLFSLENVEEKSFFGIGIIIILGIINSFFNTLLSNFKELNSNIFMLLILLIISVATVIIFMKLIKDKFIEPNIMSEFDKLNTMKDCVEYLEVIRNFEMFPNPIEYKNLWSKLDNKEVLKEIFGSIRIENEDKIEFIKDKDKFFDDKEIKDVPIKIPIQLNLINSKNEQNKQTVFFSLNEKKWYIEKVNNEPKKESENKKNCFEKLINFLKNPYISEIISSYYFFLVLFFVIIVMFYILVNNIKKYEYYLINPTNSKIKLKITNFESKENTSMEINSKEYKIWNLENKKYTLSIDNKNCNLKVESNSNSNIVYLDMQDENCKVYSFSEQKK